MKHQAIQKSHFKILKTTPNKHQTNTRQTPNKHQTSTKPTPNQHFIAQAEKDLISNPKENLKQPNPNCKTIEKNDTPKLTAQKRAKTNAKKHLNKP